jgi:hypothetical protein
MGRVKPRLVALAASLIGGALTAVGVAMVYLPAGVIVGGVGLAAFGLFVIDVDRA